MEYFNQSFEEQVNQLQGYIDHFKTRMKDEMKKPKFEPNATQEYNGYDGVTTELNKNFATMGIDKTEIFIGPEQTDKLLRSCTHIKDIQSFSKDQLRDALIGGTRRPYHDLRTDELYDDVTKNSQVEDLLDSRLLAELLLKEKIKKLETLIIKYRTIYDTCTDYSQFMMDFYNELGNMKIIHHFFRLSQEKTDYFYDTIISQEEKKLHKLTNQIDTKQFLVQDPLYCILYGGTPGKRMKHIMDNSKLARILVEIS